MAVTEREAPPTDALWWAKRTYGYGVAGSTERQIDRGQVFKLEGLPNDRLLVDLGYCAQVPKNAATYACRMCGAEFMDMGMRDAHGKYRHEERTFTPPPPPQREHGESSVSYQERLDAWSVECGRMSDAVMDRQDKLENEVAPLDLTKTTASREA